MHNKHDSHAIRVMSDDGCHLGFVPSANGDAARLAPLLFGPGGEPSAALRLDASARSATVAGRCEQYVRLRVFTAAGGAVPPDTARGLAAFAELRPPPAAPLPRLRLQPNGYWVTVDLPEKHLEAVLASNTPSSFADDKSVCWVSARCAAHRRGGGEVSRCSALTTPLAHAPPPPLPAQCERSGKWLLFVSFAEQDAVWAAIVRALQAGLLGPSAKTGPPDSSSEYESAMFCVYTHDWLDRDDVLRVGLALRAATGLKRALSYKTDAHTLAGAYGGAEGGRKVCCYTLAKGASGLVVDEAVLAVAMAMAGPEAAPPAKRARAAAAPPLVIDLLSDSEEEAAGAGVRAATAAAMARLARAGDAEAERRQAGRPEAALLGLLARWAGSSTLAAARWMLDAGTTAEARRGAVGACVADLRAAA